MTREPEGPPPVETLDPELAAFLADSASTATDARPWHQLTATEARERCRAELPLTSGAGDQSVTASDLHVPASASRQIPVRVYYPSGSQSKAPAVVFIHGGGFVLGSLDTHDAICRDMVAAGGFVCVAVDYRLSPEHRFPAALDDCVASLRWTHRHADELGIDSAHVRGRG